MSRQIKKALMICAAMVALSINAQNVYRPNTVACRRNI